MNAEELTAYLGRPTDKPCPVCKEFIIQDATGVQWCSGEECTWSNNKELQDFIETMKNHEND